MGLFRNGKTHIIAKFHRTDEVVCSHVREGKPPSYSRRNTVGTVDGTLTADLICLYLTLRKYLSRFYSYRADMFSILKSTKGHNSVTTRWPYISYFAPSLVMLYICSIEFWLFCIINLNFTTAAFKMA